jgi:AAA domain-containing protein
METSEDRPRTFIVNRGRAVQAAYREPEISAYAGNPFQEALPPYLTTDQAILRLKYYPEFRESYRKASNEIRSQLIQSSMRFFTPLDIHIDLYRRFSNLIRVGYLSRNPLSTSRKKKTLQLNTFDQYGDQYEPAQDEISSTAAGFHLAGISGIGKSFSLNRILNLFPQVIHHSNYRGRDFTHSQLVWLKIDCPFDGNPRGLCISFFKTVDAILGTTYKNNYVKDRRLQDELLSDMVTVAGNHYVGVLVIDEIQRLSLAKSGGANKLLNFFIQLVNDIGIPVVLVGTYKALEVLSIEFSYMRRGTGQGDLIWDRMKNDKEWQVFVKSLFKAQYTRKSSGASDLVPLSKKERQHNKLPQTLSDVLYEETQGITDLAVKVYMFAQERAIDSRTEIVNAGIIRSVAKDKFGMLREVLEALKYGDKRALYRFEDVYPAAFKDYLITLPDQSQAEIEVEGKFGSQPEVQAILEETSNASVETGDSNKPLESKTSITSTKRDKRKPRHERGLLPQLTADLDKNNPKAFYTALKDAGYIKSASEYL